MKLKLYSGLALALLVCLVSGGYAQEGEVKKRVEVERRGGDVMIVTTDAPPQMPGMPGDGTFIFMGAEAGAMAQRKTVKGAPYSAEGVTETVQTLSDGNRIVRKNSALLYRDAEGRTRREAALGTLGPWATAGEPSRLVMIVDPVAGVSYSLNPRNRTAVKLPFGPMQGNGLTMAGQRGNAVFTSNGNTEMHVITGGPGEGGPMRHQIETRVITREGATVTANGPGADGPKIDRKEEDLGTQTIEGVSAQGKRTTITFPAGFFGNERPLSVVDERWYSKDLQLFVMTKHSDPRSGETIYRMTNINRANPDASLFAPPSDYKVEEPKIRTIDRRGRE